MIHRRRRYVTPQLRQEAGMGDRHEALAGSRLTRVAATGALAQANAQLDRPGPRPVQRPQAVGQRPAFLRHLPSHERPYRQQDLCRADVVADGDPKGRSTPTLWGAGIRQAEWSWAGNIPSIETNIRGIIVNRMKGAEPSKETLDALAAYVKSLPNGPAPFLNADGMPRDNARPTSSAAIALFSGKAGCMTCHVPASYDKKGPEDVGSGGPFKVPSLRNVSKTGPYFHDGRFKTPRRSGHLHVGLLQEEERQQGHAERRRQARPRGLPARALGSTPRAARPRPATSPSRGRP